MAINYADLLAIAVMKRQRKVCIPRGKGSRLASPSGASDEKDAKYESVQEARHMSAA
jgi:hypothetical protein